jgi:hypothetical protein
LGHREFNQSGAAVDETVSLPPRAAGKNAEYNLEGQSGGWRLSDAINQQLPAIAKRQDAAST